MFSLRGYQKNAIASVYHHLRTRDDNPCVEIPTGGGKTPVIARICKDTVLRWEGRVLILAHVKELLEQTADKLTKICPDVKFGIYSAGLRRRDKKQSVIIAGIQSVFKRACDLGKFDLIVVDEAHLIPPDGEGMYRQFLADAKVINPNLRIIGLTATPFRLKTGDVCTSEGFLNHICFKVGVLELINLRHLCPLISRSGNTNFDTSTLSIRDGEFVPGETEILMDEHGRVVSACHEIVEQTVDRHSVLIFASGIRHGQHVIDILDKQHGVQCGFVHSKMKSRERDAVLKSFLSGDLKYLCNVNVLTTGFDAPNIDCVALLRPTASTGLYYQMVGRGLRVDPNKPNCLVLDFGGNIERHGPVDQLQIEIQDRNPGEAALKDCPSCHEMIANGYVTCPFCEHRFPDRERKQHDSKSSDAKILSASIPIETFEVRDEEYFVHTKRGAKDGDPKTLRVRYRLGLNHYQNEYICFEHTGFPRYRAERWWQQRSVEQVPESAQQAIEIIEAGGLAFTRRISIQSVPGKPFDKITAFVIGPVPTPVSSAGTDNRDEVPF